MSHAQSDIICSMNGTWSISKCFAGQDVANETRSHAPSLENSGYSERKSKYEGVNNVNMKSVKSKSAEDKEIRQLFSDISLPVRYNPEKIKLITNILLRRLKSKDMVKFGSHLKFMLDSLVSLYGIIIIVW